MRRTDLSASVCPVARSLDVVGDLWSLLLVRDALRGASRFGEFQERTGIAKNILSARLKRLVENDIFARTDDGYALTAKGRALTPVVQALWDWGTAHCPTAKTKRVRKSATALSSGACRFVAPRLPSPSSPPSRSPCPARPPPISPPASPTARSTSGWCP